MMNEDEEKGVVSEWGMVNFFLRFGPSNELDKNRGEPEKQIQI